MFRALLAVLLVTAAGLPACTGRYIPPDRTDRRERILKVDAHSGGTHHRTLFADGMWFQAFSNQLLILDPVSGRTIGSADVLPFGEGGPIVDMAVDGKTVWTVSDYTAVCAVDITTPKRPEVGEIISAKDLGIEPRRVSLAGGDVWVTGEGGAVRLRDRKRFLTGEAVGRVVQTASGPAATVGRRIIMIENGRYAGAATELQALPPGFGPDGGYLFVLQGQTSAQVGLMTPFFTETTSVAVPGLVRRARVVGEKLCIVTDVELEFWSLDHSKLDQPQSVKLKGARDIDIHEPNRYLVAGTFGRAHFRLTRDNSGEGDTFFNVQREPGLLEVAVTDRSRILAGGREGFWLWNMRDAAEQTGRTTQITSVPASRVEAAWGSAQIVGETGKATENGRSVLITNGEDKSTYTPDGSPRIQTLVLVEGDLWIGHERGVDVLRRKEKFAPLHQFRFEGPVRFIFPQMIGGGASIVSLHGGFVVFRTERVGPAPVFSDEGEVK